MTIKEALDSALKESLKSGDEIRKTTVRMALAAIKQVEVDKRTKLDDDGVISVLQKEVKNRRETIEDAKKAGRPDMVAAVENEIAILELYLPKEMDQAELKAIIEKITSEVGASSLADMGRVMKLVMPQVQGRASGDTISRAVREILNK
ncbi:MAG: GatB/YqeY domain-containing protein [Leptolinea sp.]|nr:GatB/YqeY domain-containing protein [Leptolinea sp.]